MYQEYFFHADIVGKDCDTNMYDCFNQEMFSKKLH